MISKMALAGLMVVAASPARADWHCRAYCGHTLTLEQAGSFIYVPAVPLQSAFATDADAEAALQTALAECPDVEGERKVLLQRFSPSVPGYPDGFEVADAASACREGPM